MNYLGLLFPAPLQYNEMQRFPYSVPFFVYNLAHNKYVYNLQHFRSFLKSLRPSGGYVLNCLTFNYSKHLVAIISYADAVLIFAIIYNAVLEIRFINFVFHDVENTNCCQHLFMRAIVATWKLAQKMEDEVEGN
jgi:hypothetical protein